MKLAPETSDEQLLDILRKRGAATVSELVAQMGVTATAVRQRITRLAAEGLIERKTERIGRGRPNHRYTLTAKGERTAGDNFADMASVLWEELRAVEDEAVRRGLLKRVANRLVDRYRGNMSGESVVERMHALVGMMEERQIPFAVDESPPLPVISALACPYPDLAKTDRGICAMEKMMISEVLGEEMRLATCRLDGANCCTFTPSIS
ncbi:MAG: MarR family transcriptional regulator [Pirellulales bacterium]|nr:MarR family transcriptional regulator [Pirellulales bacterium]